MNGLYPIGLLPGESVFAVWGRRVVSFTAIALAFAVSWTGSVLALPGLYLWDTLCQQSKLAPRTRSFLFLLTYLTCEALGLLAAFWLWICTLGGSLVSPQRYRHLHFELQKLWTSALFAGAKRIFSLKVEVESELNASQSRSFLLWVRHTSLADTVLAAVFVANPLSIGLRYILKKELLWDPCLDVVGRRLPNVFVDRSGRQRDIELQNIQTLARDLGDQESVLIYPEGTRFSLQKRTRALAKLESMGEPELLDLAQAMTSVLPPRLGGSLALLDAAPNLDLVILAHTGFEQAATVQGIWTGALVGQMLRVHIRRIPRSAVPERQRERWIFEQWLQLDRWVSTHQSVPLEALK